MDRPGGSTFEPFAIVVPRAEAGRLVDIAAFEQPSPFPAFCLPASIG